MKSLYVRNVHEALPRALFLLDSIGVKRDSRNGPVLFGGSVATVYERPVERVMFWPERNANPFFHLYESLWMLAGRNDVAPLCRYVKRSAEYSDNGATLHGAYGRRWRAWFDIDQLPVIVERLKNDPDDRRCVLQMWDAETDLLTNDQMRLLGIGKDVPCNTIATFQRGISGELNLTVFCRSNDIVWGAYGANAVQFGALLEYMAMNIGCPVGTYTQVSVNWHGYVNTIEGVWSLRNNMPPVDPYSTGWVKVIPMAGDGTPEELDRYIEDLLNSADTDFEDRVVPGDHLPWTQMCFNVLLAHHNYKTGGARAALEILQAADQTADWVVAARQWLERKLV